MNLGPVAVRALVALTQAPSFESMELIIEIDSLVSRAVVFEENIKPLNLERIKASTTLLKEQYSLSKEAESIYDWTRANEFLISNLATNDSLNEEIVLGIYRKLASGFADLRSEGVQGGNCLYPEASSLPELWKRFWCFFGEHRGSHPIVRASIVYQWMVTLHFFSDGNGRLSRLAADWVLLKDSYPPISFPNDASAFISALDEDACFTVDDAIVRICDGIKNSLGILSKQV